MDVGGDQMQPVAHITVTWHRWFWNRPGDAAGIAWEYMATEAALISGCALALMLVLGVVARLRRQ